MNSPSLWIVATPIGNNGDLSPRARDVLESVDLVLAEDTRKALRLFKDIGIEQNNVISFFEHNEKNKEQEIIKKLKSGVNIALISDAGTPTLADPGYRLVRACRKEGIIVSAIPGASAPVTAISAAGIPPLPFTFLGFLPRGERDRRAIFSQYCECPGSIIFFERKDRLEESLRIAYAIFKSREIAICRELTKTYEEFIIGRLENYENLCINLLGELTIIIGPAEEIERTPRAEVLNILREKIECGYKLRRAAKETQSCCEGWSSAEIYALAIEPGFSTSD